MVFKSEHSARKKSTFLNEFSFRITERSMTDPHKLMEHVKSTIDSATKNGNYSFVLDMSWSNFDASMTRKFMNNIGTLIDLDYRYVT